MHGKFPVTIMEKTGFLTGFRWCGIEVKHEQKETVPLIDTFCRSKRSELE